MLSGNAALRRAATGLLCATALLAAPVVADAAPLRAGVGRADITPPTGYVLGGWTRADRVSRGQHTRLYASAMVLKRGGRKVALVAVDLAFAPGGLVLEAARQAGHGFSDRNVLVSASHTHAGPNGFANFETYNTSAPSMETIDDPSSFVELLDPLPADRQLYTFLVERIAAAIRRADRDLGPAKAAWGSARLLDVTRNRSLEAHLANHGIKRPFGAGRVEEDPGGHAHTIDPGVNVLRVDKLARCRGSAPSRCRRRIPIGAWSTFANHGTVVPAEFEHYNQDHHGAANRVLEHGVRRAGHVPRRQLVVNVYGNTDEGDQSAGLDQTGPAHAEWVGRREARSMLSAWRRAGRRLTRRPRLGLRWTRVCFCGQRTEAGRVASSPAIGAPFLTGSEEGRGPLFDVTGVPFEGRRSPVEQDDQGHKLGVSGIPDSVPQAVPLLAVRVGPRMIVSFPGEATAEVGRRTRAALREETSGSGIRRVVVSGLANEYLQYFTTPEEYDRQHYEGGSMLFGPFAATLLQEELTELARRLVRGRPAQPPYPFDPLNGVEPDGAPYGRGAASGTIERQPRRAYRRLGHAELSWRGAPRGLDRPLDDPFVIVERRKRDRWRRAADDLGLELLWSVDDEGGYTARWEIPRDARRGTYRLVVSARRYRLRSRPFRVRPSRALAIEPLAAGAGRVAVAIRYPEAERLRDFTWRPRRARGGAVRFRVGAREVTVRRRRGRVFSTRAPRGERVEVPAGAARDRHGNRNREPALLLAD